MAGGPLVIVGSLKVGASSVSCTDVSGVVSSFRLKFTRDIIDVPPTLLATMRSPRLGWGMWSVDIVYFSNPDASSASFLTRRFIAASTDTASNPPGSLYFEGTLLNAPVSTSNPKWSGRFLVAGAGYGGQVGEVSTDSQTFPMTSAPTEVFV